MMDHTDSSSPMGKQHRVTKLTASLLSLLIGSLSVVLLFLALRAGNVVSASRREDTSSGSIYQTFNSAAAAGATSAANIIKTVESHHSDTSEVVPTCSSIRGLVVTKSLDIVLAQDVSGSMTYTDGLTQTRLAVSQQAAIAFVNLLSSTDRIAVVPYSETTYLALPLTTTKSAVTQTILSLTADGLSNIGEGISVSLQELITSSPRYVSDTIKAIILLSDGTANLPDKGVITGTEYARQQARVAANDNIRIYTIGFGSEADEALLRDIANISGGRYFSATDSSTLQTIYSALNARGECHYLPMVFRNWTAPGIVNGDFEYGWTGWITGGELSRSIVSTPTHSGNFSARLGDPAYICQNGVPVGSAWMEQTFTVPDTNEPKLRFWYRIFTYDVNPYLSNKLDRFVFKINNTEIISDAKRGGNYGCAHWELADLGWKSWESGLSDYRGQQVTVTFENWNEPEKWYNTWTFVDDVQVTP